VRQSSALNSGLGFSGIKRFSEITRVLIRHGFGAILTKSALLADDELAKLAEDPIKAPIANKAVRLRLAFQELGPSFIKLGQLLSSRADILPEPYILELQKLQDRVPALSFDQIKPQLEDVFGKDTNATFAEFTEDPIAAASVAQVYAATLASGQKVAVKIIRPGIHKQIRGDIRVMYFFAKRFESAFETARMLGLTNIVREFERTVFNELDMHIEAGTIDKFARHYQYVNEIHIPKVFWDLTSKSILVMEFVKGVKVDQVEAIVEMGLEPKHIAMIGLRSLSKQLMEFGVIHADPHPGNTIVMPDGRVGLVDFGIISHLDRELMQHLAHLFLGYAARDYDLVMEALIGAGLIDETNVRLDQFRSDLKEISEPFYGRSLQTISVKDVYDQIIGLVMEYHIQLPRNLLLLFKTLIQTERLGKILGSDAGILQVIRPYAAELLRTSYGSEQIMADLTKEARFTGNMVRSLPRYLLTLLKQIATGKGRFELHHAGISDATNRFERGLNRFIVAMIIAASTIAGALALNAPKGLLEITLPFLSADPISLTALLGVTAYVIATVLGIWLIISIVRSGRI
jgi:ubiquinone biosynthesis protein